MLSCGIVRAKIPRPTFVKSMENVTGIASFMPVTKTPLTRLTANPARFDEGESPIIGTD